MGLAPQVSLEIYPSMIKFVGSRKEVDSSSNGSQASVDDLNADEGDLPF